MKSFTLAYLQFGPAMTLMLVLPFSLIMTFLRLDIARNKEKGPVLWLIDIPFSIYLGWITVVTIAIATQLLSVSG